MSEPARSARVLGMIGLAKRAGYLLCGTDAVISSAASGKKPPLVVCASDASERTKKQLSDKCATYGVTLAVIPCTKDELARYAGKKDSQLSAAAVCDRGMAEKIIILVNS